ncbi:MAG: hypothetical protein GF364_00570 [Candidatus Lokiarchaeota archaeon]|nr:hypothetical protein [Candidatus Lokiarchaeota archaeon]
MEKEIQSCIDKLQSYPELFDSIINQFEDLKSEISFIKKLKKEYQNPDKSTIELKTFSEKLDSLEASIETAQRNINNMGSDISTLFHRLDNQSTNNGNGTEALKKEINSVQITFKEKLRQLENNIKDNQTEHQKFLTQTELDERLEPINNTTNSLRSDIEESRSEINKLSQHQEQNVNLDSIKQELFDMIEQKIEEIQPAEVKHEQIEILQHSLNQMGRTMFWFIEELRERMDKKIESYFSRLNLTFSTSTPLLEELYKRQLKLIKTVSLLEKEKHGHDIQ